MEAMFLLSNEFVEFSTHIKELHDEKVRLTEEFKAAHAAYKASLKALDEKALSLQNAFEDWKKTQVKEPKGD